MPFKKFSQASFEILTKQVKSNLSCVMREYTIGVLTTHPWAGEDLSLKIDAINQTIWKINLKL